VSLPTSDFDTPQADRSSVGQTPAPERSSLAELATRARQSWRRRARDLLGRQLSSGFTSLLVHATVLLILAAVVRVPERPVSLPMQSEIEGDGGGSAELDGGLPAAPLPGPAVAPDAIAVDPALASREVEIKEALPEHSVALVLPQGTVLPQETVLTQNAVLPQSTAPAAVEGSDQLADSGAESASKSVPLTAENPPPAAVVSHLASGGGFEGRVGAKRGELLRQWGGTVASEEAVERGLGWLALHQRADGSWNFNHQNETCNGYCRDPGNYHSTTAATGLALLPFLGAGHTQKVGEHREVVAKGIYYLGNQMVLTPQGGDVQDGSMYGQGIASIALCEAYAMTKDEALKPFAQSAIDFIVSAQEPRGGGWRYTPGQPGDTTMLGWQLMALKSGKLAGLKVPYETLRLVEKFLDSVQTDYGAGYGYLTPEKRQTTTAVGLLCRMYTGWPRNRDAIIRGAGYLDHHGPDEHDMYFNYYSTQVLHHFGGAPWQRWNEKMRERLIATQGRAGHENGSWYFPDEHGTVGGRLYITAMAIMTLEVYYRHMPLYGAAALGR
jgi:hypothetical protein